ncbi:hypothetical protein CAPTEDRAFT_186778 [Capitella teleta]|uniref:Uncharacterized protein n=1 Tax=Capitella teleta TaxID=283909 RepID=R7UGY1_CAPTE|nr:hypothetical protein CAPTEDRAFT_186778 [Capitella teleta]|eukprot:ELU03048.1 hypothetical protein CAPTEDRAFT_186778 [Capitella teleta]
MDVSLFRRNCRFFCHEYLCTMSIHSQMLTKEEECQKYVITEMVTTSVYSTVEPNVTTSSSLTTPQNGAMNSNGLGKSWIVMIVFGLLSTTIIICVSCVIYKCGGIRCATRWWTIGCRATYHCKETVADVRDENPEERKTGSVSESLVH